MEFIATETVRVDQVPMFDGSCRGYWRERDELRGNGSDDDLVGFSGLSQALGENFQAWIVMCTALSTVCILAFALWTSPSAKVEMLDARAAFFRSGRSL